MALVLQDPLQLTGADFSGSGVNRTYTFANTDVVIKGMVVYKQGTSLQPYDQFTLSGAVLTIAPFMPDTDSIVIYYFADEETGSDSTAVISADIGTSSCTNDLLEITRGDTKTLTVTVTENSTAYDLTGFTAKFTAKISKTDQDEAAAIGPITGTISAPTSGIIVFELSSEDTDVAKDYYYYDVEITSSSKKITLLNDKIKVVEGVTGTDPDETAEATLTVTEDELRMFLQFDANDYPNRTEMRFFIKVAMKKIALDIDSSNDNILFIATLLLAKSYVLRGLATKSVSKGYVQVNAEGRTITKAYQEFVLEAENVLQEYKEFILNTARVEAIATNYMDNTSMVDSLTRQGIIDIMNGTSNAMDAQSSALRTYFDGIRNT